LRLLGEQIVGLIPAAGQATRLAGSLSCSKEIAPVEGRPVCAHLLAAMLQAGISRAVWVVRHGKEDIREVLGDGGGLASPKLEYVEILTSASVPETLSHGLRRIGDRPVAMGFPDVLAEPSSALTALIERYRRGEADVVLGLFPTDRPDTADMVRIDDRGVLLDILHKPGPGTGLSLTWLLAVWGPAFSRRLQRFVVDREGPVEREPQVSDVLKAALADGLRLATVAFPAGSHLDVGTPEDLRRAREQVPGT
jgi:glucose-1-phosphate thymidylyltransferase